MLLVCLAVGWAVFQVGSRHEVLQDDLLSLGNLVELVEVDECEGGEAEVQVGLVLEVDAVVVVFALFTRQQDAALRGLATPLPSHY